MPRAWLLAVALALAAACWGIGSYPLLEPDEGRNAEVAREMARGGDYILPHLDGLPYLDKPAPYFAVVALSLKVFGEHEGAARFPSLLCTIITALLVWRLGRRMGNDAAGGVAAVALLTMPLAFAFSRTVIFDAMLMMIETATLACAWRALADGADWRWAAGAWAAMGLGAVTKGPVAIIVPLLVVATYGIMARVRLRPFFTWRAWPWLFVTGLPWFIAVTLRRPDFPRYAFIYESLERVATKTHGRAAPWWFFIPVALAGTFPWSVPAVAGLWRAARSWSARREAASRPAVFLVTWAMVPLIFFSLSQSKLPHYYLPALPGVALGAGLTLTRGRADAPTRGIRSLGFAAAACMALVAIALVASSAYLPSTLTGTGRAAVSAFAGLEGVAVLFAALVAALAAWRRWPFILAVALALPVIKLPFLATDAMRAIGDTRSSRSLAAAIDQAAPGAPVVLAGTYPTSLRWYLDRPVLVATATGKETTSNYVASRIDEFRALPDSPLRAEAWWREALTACSAPMVFVARRNSAADSALVAALPLIAMGGADGRSAAYGPCRPQDEGRSAAVGGR